MYNHVEKNKTKVLFFREVGLVLKIELKSNCLIFLNMYNIWLKKDYNDNGEKYEKY